MTLPKVAMLQLANRPLTPPGSVNRAETFGLPVTYRQVPSAFVGRIVAQDPSLRQAYVETARGLARDGAEVIGSNCGLTALYHDALRSQVDAMVVTSSLFAMPQIARALPPKRLIGLLTYDRDLCGRQLLEVVGIAAERVVTAGLNGTASYERLAEESPSPDPDVLAADLLGTLERLLAQSPDIGAIVVECTTFCPLVGELRKRSGLPVYDYVWFLKSQLAGYDPATA